jgi:hypothetical protein
MEKKLLLIFEKLKTMLNILLEVDPAKFLAFGNFQLLNGASDATCMIFCVSKCPFVSAISILANQTTQYTIKSR